MIKEKSLIFLWITCLLLMSCGLSASDYIGRMGEKASCATGNNDINLSEAQTFFGEWQLKELSWYNEHYFATEQVQEEMSRKVGKPINNVTIFILQNEYKEISEKDDYELIISNPDYFFDSFFICEGERTYNTINSISPYLDKIGLDNQDVLYLSVRDPTKSKMDSGEVDWYYIPNKVFLIVNENTLLLTNEKCVELYTCERITN